ncbi:MAG: NnrU family protein [Ramlibacter sp.]
MAVLILGLVLFLGVHSVRIVADGWRTATIARMGQGAWKGIYALASIAGFVLIVWGFGRARANPVYLYEAPMALRHVAGALMVVSFILLVATYVPRNSIKARLHHPMVLAVKVWALAHLLANGNLGDVVLFGSFLLWAVLSFRAARARDRAAGVVYPPGTAAGTGMAIALGIVLWAGFAFWAHGYLFGVRPFG